MVVVVALIVVVVVVVLGAVVVVGASVVVLLGEPDVPERRVVVGCASDVSESVIVVVDMAVDMVVGGAQGMFCRNERRMNKSAPDAFAQLSDCRN